MVFNSAMKSLHLVDGIFIIYDCFVEPVTGSMSAYVAFSKAVLISLR